MWKKGYDNDAGWSNLIDNAEEWEDIPDLVTKDGLIVRDEGPDATEHQEGFSLMIRPRVEGFVPKMALRRRELLPDDGRRTSFFFGGWDDIRQHIELATDRKG